MRLIELRFKNLNSLKGEWLIDFSDPAFINEGIFAITGQTGAGKTTILDAICLALYSKTPRLGDITGSTNDLMTQNTGECFAEVTIEVESKRYTCHWYQHRAHKKPKGKLSSIKHEICEAGTGKILEENKTKTLAYIQDLLKMDFDQFTRSIMLAQGDFAAFLKSDIAVRAAMLEKITGTAIYSLISKKVYEKHRSEEAKLNQLKAGLSGDLELLSKEQEQTLQASQDSMREETAKYTVEQQAVNEKVKWLDAVAELKVNISQYQMGLDQAQQAQNNFAADSARLDNANKALEIESDFSKLEHTRQSIAQLQQDNKSIAEQLPREQASLENSANGLKNSKQQVILAIETLEQALPNIAKTRQLDIDIRQISQALNEDEKRQVQQVSIITRLEGDIKADKQSKLDTEQQLAKAHDYLASHQHLINLETDIANIDSTCVQIKSLLHKNGELANDNLTYQSQLDKHHLNLDELNKQVATSQEQIEAKGESLAKAQQQQSALLNNQSLSDIRDQQDAIDDSSAQLENISHNLHQFNERTSQLMMLMETLPSIESNLTDIKQHIKTLDDDIKAAKSKRQDKQNYLNLLQQVAKLEDYIDQLESGAPCPLCGATEHPYTEHHPLRETDNSAGHNSKTAQTEQEINQLDQQIEALAHRLSEARIEQATEQNNHARLDADLSTIRKQAESLTATIKIQIGNLPTTLLLEPIVKELVKLTQTFMATDNEPDKAALQSKQIQAITASSQSSLKLINDAKSTLSEVKQAIKQLLNDYETVNALIISIEKEIAVLERATGALTKQIGEAHTEQKLATQRLESNNKDINDNFSELSSLLAALSQPLNKYQQDIPAQSTDACSIIAYKKLSESIDSRQILTGNEIEHCLTTFRQFRTSLKTLKTHYDIQVTAKQTLDTVISNLDIHVKSSQSQLDESQPALVFLKKQIEDKTHQLEASKAQREKLLADKEPDAEESRLRALVDNAKTKHNEAQRQYDSASQLVKQLKDNQQAINQQLTTAQKSLNIQLTAFEQQLNEQGFSNEQSFKTARLPKAERDALSAQKQQVMSNFQRSQSLLTQSENLLTEKLANPLTHEAREKLINYQQHLQSLINDLNKGIGSIEQRLNSNKAIKEKNKAQEIAIERQEQELKVWQHLYKLIGSESGKKFRTFAQGLTFQIMVSHANAKLQKMSDRYLLIRDDDEPLELKVLDKYQGGEIRSTKNLSGGEGFIISLALALGLSQMASQNIRVDSLFLDEGFGTLDEDSLEIALTTLTGLQQEGKLIGVISHVQALKDRILTQVKVEKISGGHSKLSGAGCRQVAS